MAALEKICAQEETDRDHPLHRLANAMLVSEGRSGLYRIANAGHTEAHTAFVMSAASALLFERQTRHPPCTRKQSLRIGIAAW
jgi:hypothetical protein